jgi:hypothetical protein
MERASRWFIWPIKADALIYSAPLTGKRAYIHSHLPDPLIFPVSSSIPKSGFYLVVLISLACNSNIRFSRPLPTNVPPSRHHLSPQLIKRSRTITRLLDHLCHFRRVAFRLEPHVHVHVPCPLSVPAFLFSLFRPRHPPSSPPLPLSPPPFPLPSPHSPPLLISFRVHLHRTPRFHIHTHVLNNIERSV